MFLQPVCELMNKIREWFHPEKGSDLSKDTSSDISQIWVQSPLLPLISLLSPGANDFAPVSLSRLIYKMGYVVTQPTLLKGHKELKKHVPCMPHVLPSKFGYYYYYFYDNCYFCERARTEFQGMSPNHIFLHEVGLA